MSNQLKTIEVRIEANAKDFEKQLKGISSQLNQLTEATGSINQSVGKNFTGSIMKANVFSRILVGTLRSVGRGIAQLGVEIFKTGGQYVRLQTATNRVTQNLGITADEVANLRNQLAESNTYGSRAEEVIRTLATSGLVRMADSLETVDARTGELTSGVTSLVLVMKDLGASAGIDSADAINRITQFINRGTTATVEGMVAIGNMATEYREYADSIGKTRAELSGYEEAQVRMNIIMREGQKAWGTYAETMETSGKALGSIRDIMENLKEMLGAYLEPIFASVTRGIFFFLNGLRTALTDNAETFKQWANRVAGYVIAVIRVLGALLTRIPVIGKYFNDMRNFAIKPVTMAMDSLSGSANKTSEAMDNASGSTKALKKELLGLSGFDEMNVLKQPEEGGGTGSVGGMGAGGLDIGEMISADAINQSVDDINRFADEIEKELIGKLKELNKAIEPLKEPLKKLGKWLWDNKTAIALIGIALAGLIGTVKVISTVLATFGTVWGWVAGIVSGIVGIFAKGGLLDSALLTIMYAIDGVKAGVIALAGALGISVGWLLVIIGAIIVVTVLLVKNWDWVKEKSIQVWTWMVDSVFKPVGEWFSKIFNTMVDTVKDWFEKISEFFNKVKTEVFDPIAEEISKIVNGLIIPIIHNFLLVSRIAWEELRDVINRVWNEIQNKAIKPVVDWINTRVLEVITWVVDGVTNQFNKLKNGVKTAWGWIKDKAIKPVIDWIKTYIMPIIYRVADGFIRAFQTVKDVVAGIWEGLKNIFKGGINWIIGKINGFASRINGYIEDYNRTVGVLPDAMKITYRFGKIPELAEGGVIESPTIAQIGEAGREVVLPLDNNTEWMNDLADKMGGGQIHLTVKVGDDKVGEKLIDYIADKNMRTNLNTINI